MKGTEVLKDRLTPKEAKEKLRTARTEGTLYLHSFYGKHRVTGFDLRGWAYAPDANAGFGATFAVSGPVFTWEEDR